MFLGRVTCLSDVMINCRSTSTTLLSLRILTFQRPMKVVGQLARFGVGGRGCGPAKPS
eukprot:CAMPEP_0176055794 /NCGR_PEP_ID=MMETSP0120_2-20121206/27780_1 /TAXON_ID=160619 /ORGANISM="Kryptoperidinium foliaceum, Strain CCMP 1326" /LENGTH=57 /DNA_ID=CAMNT_0017389293 /DNA_START=132 /DNA_END=301 /DNA_ORIENTATION=+